MNKYAVYGKVVGTKYLGEIEANTEKEAANKAIEKSGHICLCHNCVSECEDAEIEDFIVEKIS